MPATATATTVVPASDLHANDEVHFADGTTLRVESVSRRQGQVLVTFWNRATVRVAADVPTSVTTQHGCDCNGTGVYSWGTITNGVPAHTGEHFACHGKGWQSRQDVVRNHTYWAKYARLV